MSSKVVVIPAELRYHFQPDKQLVTTVAFMNPSSHTLAFKIKTTIKEEYMVRPSKGLIPPHSGVAVLVVKQAHEKYTPDLAADKLLVQIAELGETEQIGDYTFDKDVHNDLTEFRLRVIVEKPTAALPPSADSCSCSIS